MNEASVVDFFFRWSVVTRVPIPWLYACDYVHACAHVGTQFYPHVRAPYLIDVPCRATPLPPSRDV